MIEHDEAPSGLPLDALRAAWRTQPLPPLARELPQTDEATRRAVLWLASAWRAQGVLEPSATAAQRARFAARRRALPQREPASARRQVAAAALLLALLTAALHLEALPWLASRPSAPPAASPQAERPHAKVPGAVPPLAARPLAESPPGAPPPATPPRAERLPAAPAVQPAGSDALLAAAAPLELRSGSVRLILFTDASQRTPENLP